jgi:hypothetical protein
MASQDDVPGTVPEVVETRQLGRVQTMPNTKSNGEYGSDYGELGGGLKSSSFKESVYGKLKNTKSVARKSGLASMGSAMQDAGLET